ncbi:MAG: HAMP domain-containing histidine kinase [Proteobacteria bacterium]|nr:HAMP domain-containing histidine kinase [Pseudomonadota bacterium]MBU1737428.1 HAMP domain-containing histidine kinase [Pseudomonadota bacterium]
MKRLRLILIVFALLLTVPLVWLVTRTYDGLAREETSQLAFFAETILDQMEVDLSQLINREEGRSVDEYGKGPGATAPLAARPKEDFIIGYFQNGPDGSFRSPMDDPEKDLVLVNDELREVNELFNRKRETAVLRPEPVVKPAVRAEQFANKKKEASFAERYLSSANLSRQRTAVNQEEKRVEEITISQASQIATRKPSLKSLEADFDALASNSYRADNLPAAAPAPMMEGLAGAGRDNMAAEPMIDRMTDQAVEAETDIGALDAIEPRRSTFKVEISPLQSLLIDRERAFIFRNILLQGESYRQGFVIRIPALFEHLATRYFRNEPMARFTALQLAVTGKEAETANLAAGITASDPVYTVGRTFPRPFSFISASLSCDKIPASSGRRTLLIMSIGLTVIVLLGFLAVYQSARVIHDLSERKTGFVSSVTHELKTPLTNIRLYIEMLEQGMAKSPEQEQEYFRIVGSESNRLVRLINNVLEFAKLEKRQRSVNLRPGDLSEVVSEVKDILHDRLRQEDFTFTTRIPDEFKPFSYDREIMVQILTNLVENSIKFGSRSPVREITLKAERSGQRVLISVADTGPGIPEQARKKVFDDFYRVENALTRQTKGTGIGLALVRKFTVAMGGTVSIANNPGAGCTVTVSLPEK